MGLKERIKLFVFYVEIAFIANIPVWILSYINDSLGNASEIWYMIASFYLFTSVIGGAYGGYILCSRLNTFNLFNIVVQMGALSYSILTIVNILIGFETWMDGIAIPGFLAGYAIGSRIIELRRLEKKK